MKIALIVRAKARNKGYRRPDFNRHAIASKGFKSLAPLVEQAYLMRGATPDTYDNYNAWAGQQAGRQIPFWHLSSVNKAR